MHLYLSKYIPLYLRISNSTWFAVFLPLVVLLISCQPTINYEAPVLDIKFPVSEINIKSNLNSYYSSQLSYCQSDSISAGYDFDVVIAEIDSTSSLIPITKAGSLYSNSGIGCTLDSDMVWSKNGEYLLASDYNPNGVYIIKRTARDTFASPAFFFDLPPYTNFRGPRLLSISPSDELAFVGQKAIDFPSVYVSSSDGRVPRLTYEAMGVPGVISRPAWSHSGAQIALTSPLTSTGYSENGLIVLDVDSGIVTAEFTPDTHPQIPAYSAPLDLNHALPNNTVAWLPGDNLILFMTKGESQTQNILWAASLKTRQLIRIREGQLKDMAVSPQGDRLAIMAHTSAGDLIEVISLNQSLTSLFTIDAMDFDALSKDLTMSSMDWSSDGQFLAFSVKILDQFDLYLFQVSDREIFQLTETRSRHEIGASWSP